MRSIGKQPKGSLTVQGTRTHGIFYKAKSDLDLIGFTDSDWEGDSTDRNRVPLHSHLQKQSTEELLMQQLNVYGCKVYLESVV